MTEIEILAGKAAAEPFVRPRAERRPPISLRPTLHPLDRIVRELVPYFGADCQISVVYNASGVNQTVVQGTLSTILDALHDTQPVSTPVLFVG